MQPQLLFFDIDGTLLSNDTHQIPESALNAIAAAQKNGHLAFINTGRTLRTMPAFLKELGLMVFSAAAAQELSAAVKLCWLILFPKRNVAASLI